MMALEHPAVREAVAALAARGLPVVTLISDLSNSERAAFVGLDNRAAGRTAGYLIGRFIGARAAKVALIAGSLSYKAHEEREAGFLHVIDEMFPRLEVVGLREGQDDAGKNYRQTRALLEQHPDMGGIYNIGGASDGVARALKEAGREQHGRGDHAEPAHHAHELRAHLHQPARQARGAQRRGDDAQPGDL
jgi:LacI family transcriptional regulator